MNRVSIASLVVSASMVGSYAPSTPPNAGFSILIGSHPAVFQSRAHGPTFTDLRHAAVCKIHAAASAHPFNQFAGGCTLYCPPTPQTPCSVGVIAVTVGHTSMH